MTESFYHSGGFSVEWSRAKPTRKQNIFDKTTLRHTEGIARRIYTKSTRKRNEFAGWGMIQRKDTSAKASV